MHRCCEARSRQSWGRCGCCSLGVLEGVRRYCEYLRRWAAQVVDADKFREELQTAEVRRDRSMPSTPLRRSMLSTPYAGLHTCSRACTCTHAHTRTRTHTALVVDGLSGALQVKAVYAKHRKLLQRVFEVRLRPNHICTRTGLAPSRVLRVRA